MDKLED